MIGIPRAAPDMNRVRGSSPDLQIPDIDYLMTFSNWEGLNLSGLDFSDRDISNIVIDEEIDFTDAIFVNTIMTIEQYLLLRKKLIDHQKRGIILNKVEEFQRSDERRNEIVKEKKILIMQQILAQRRAAGAGGIIHPIEVIDRDSAGNNINFLSDEDIESWHPVSSRDYDNIHKFEEAWRIGYTSAIARQHENLGIDIRKNNIISGIYDFYETLHPDLLEARVLQNLERLIDGHHIGIFPYQIVSGIYLIVELDDKDDIVYPNILSNHYLNLTNWESMPMVIHYPDVSKHKELIKSVKLPYHFSITYILNSDVGDRKDRDFMYVNDDNRLSYHIGYNVHDLPNIKKKLSDEHFISWLIFNIENITEGIGHQFDGYSDDYGIILKQGGNFVSFRTFRCSINGFIRNLQYMGFTELDAEFEYESSHLHDEPEPEPDV